MITEKEYNRILGKLSAIIDEEDYENLMEVVSSFEELLNQADYDDYYGTEGWRHTMGWD